MAALGRARPAPQLRCSARCGPSHSAAATRSVDGDRAGIQRRRPNEHRRSIATHRRRCRANNGNSSVLVRGDPHARFEGYWGTNRVTEWVAGRRCGHYRKVHKKLEVRLACLTEAAWKGAASEIERIQQELVDRGGPVEFTPNMISALGAPVLRRKPTVTLTQDEEEIVRNVELARLRASRPA